MMNTNDVPMLPGPYEILELQDGQSIVLTVTEWEVGKATITPRDGREPKTVRMMRVHIPRAEKLTLPHYYDITAQHLVAGLEGNLAGNPVLPRRFRVTKVGQGAKARFRLETVPLT